MAKTQKVRLIVAATAFLALSLPGSSSAQFIQSLGTWTGVDTFDITVTNFFTGQLISSDSGSGPATLSIGIDAIEIDGGTTFPIIGEGDIPPAEFGSTSASGSINFNDGPGGSFVGNFFLTYESILPNGQIDVGNGSAVADLTTVEFDFGESFSNSFVIVSFATFTTVPEPPSSVLAGLAILVIAAVAWVRRFRRRLQLAQVGHPASAAPDFSSGVARPALSAVAWSHPQNRQCSYKAPRTIGNAAVSRLRAIFLTAYKAKCYPIHRRSDYSSAHFKPFVHKEIRLELARVGLFRLFQRLDITQIPV
jgi:hypothetical protein